MNFPPENFYADWRRKLSPAGTLHDDQALPPEKLLQAIWRQQRLQRDRLKTADGRVLRVLHPGFLSVAGGPDFRGAVLQIGHAPAVAGDVEIDLHPGGWRAHGHDRNPNFQTVILHVVWDNPKPNPDVPAVLALKDVLDSPLTELALALENDSGLPENQRGRCSAPLQELDQSRLAAVLNGAAQVRFENKAAALLARAKNSGWEQALWENLFRALGYKHNVPIATKTFRTPKSLIQSQIFRCRDWRSYLLHLQFPKRASRWLGASACEPLSA